MEINPVGSPTERYYGNLDVPDGGYVGNEDGLPLIIFDYAAEALQLGGTNILGAGNIEGTGLNIAGTGTFDAVVIDGTVDIGLDMSGGTFGTAIQKWPGGTIQSTGDIVFQPTADSTTFFQVLDADGGTPVLNVDTVNERVGIGTDSPTNSLHVKVAGIANSVFESSTGSMSVTYKGAGAGAEVSFFMNTGLDRARIMSTVNGTNGGLLAFSTRADGGAITERMRINEAGNVGLNETAAETLLELTHATPYITLHNSTHEDSDGGRESRLIFKGEQSGGEETELAVLEVSHDGVADDQLGKLVLGVNTGAGVVDALTIDSNKVVTIPGIGDGGLTNYDLKIGDTSTPDYGMIQIGNSVIGRTSYKAGNIDLDGTIMVRNIGGPVTSEVEFIWTESAGNTCRFALPKSAVGNATYNSRSMLLAGPAPADTDFVKVSYWQGQGIFDNLACDTASDGADLGVQNDLEVEGDIFIDSIKESTAAAGVSIGDGGVTDYAQFAADGELTLAGTARVIKHVQAIDELGKGGSAPTVRTTEEPYVSYTYAVNNDSHITFEIPEDMDFTVASTIKLHWYTSVDQTDDEVNWEARWNSRAPGEVVNAGETIDTSGDINCPTQWVILESTIETVPANSCAAGDIFGLHLERIAIVDGTNPAATSIHALSVELEYTANKLGEAT